MDSPTPGAGATVAADGADLGLVTDACAFHEWTSSATLAPYLGPEWARLLGSNTAYSGPMNVKSIWRFVNPHGNQATEAFPDEGLAGSDPELFAGQVLDTGKRGRTVLGYHDGLLATAYSQSNIVREIVRAANDWTIDRWLDRDPRLYGQVQIASAQPDEAAAEIRRVGSHGQMVAVDMGANRLGQHFGRPIYRPIHEAAAELGLPLVIQAGADGASDLPTPPTGAGLPATFAEYNIHSAQGLMVHASSFITEGVFDRHPDLRVLLVGGGASWVPWCLWRFDYNWRIARARETPWMRSPPSDYFTEFIRLGTYQLESPEPERLLDVLSTIPNVESMFLYASGYPNWDWEEPEAIAARLPQEWHERVFNMNADAFFRWPEPAPPE
jgi:predicted TIM-barrel fold metal-dependent hydrolase